MGGCFRSKDCTILSATGIILNANKHINVKDKKALESFVSRNDIVKEFVNIQQQFIGLTYLTPENFDNPKTSENKFFNKIALALSEYFKCWRLPEASH